MSTPRLLQSAGVVSLVVAAAIMGYWFVAGAFMVTQYEVAKDVPIEDEFGSIDEIDDDMWEDVDDFVDEDDAADDFGDADDDTFEDIEDDEGQADETEEEDDQFAAFDEDDDGDSGEDDDPFAAFDEDDDDDPFDEFDVDEDDEAFDDDNIDDPDGPTTTVWEEEFRFGLLPDRGYDGATPLAGFFLVLGIGLIVVGRRKASSEDVASGEDEDEQ